MLGGDITGISRFLKVFRDMSCSLEDVLLPPSRLLPFQMLAPAFDFLVSVCLYSTINSADLLWEEPHPEMPKTVGFGVVTCILQCIVVKTKVKSHRAKPTPSEPDWKLIKKAFLDRSIGG